MNCYDISAVADLFIKEAEFDRSKPFYTEEGFQRKLRRNHRQEKQLRRERPDISDATRMLRRQEMEFTIKLAKLSAKQNYVFRQRLDGVTFEEIGRKMQTSKQATNKIYFLARQKVRNAHADNPYRGLAEVYRQETRRYGKSRSFANVHSFER